MTEGSKAAAIATIGQRRLSKVILEFSERVGPDPDFGAGDLDVEFALQNLPAAHADGSHYLKIQGAASYIGATAAQFMSRGSRCLGSAMIVFRSGNPDIALLDFYNAALFFVRAASACFGVIHYDFNADGKRRQCLIDLFPGLAQPQLVKQIEKTVPELTQSARVTFASAKWEHIDVFKTFAALSSSVTRPDTLSPYLTFGRKADYRTISSPRNAIVYGRDRLPFSIDSARRFGLATKFSNPFEHGVMPFKNSDASDVIDSAWYLFSLCRELCETFGGSGSTLGTLWADHLFGEDSPSDYFDFYWGSGATDYSTLRAPA